MLHLLLLLACGPEPMERTITAIDSVCVDGREFLVTFEGCISSSCTTVLSATCEVDFDGSVAQVTGEAVIQQAGEECTMDCGILDARCPVPEGADWDEVIVTFGGDDGGPTLADAACWD